MPPDSSRPWPSLHGPNVRSESFRHPIDSSVPYEFGGRGLLLSKGVSERLNGDIFADMAAMFEAVGYGLRHAVDRHVDPLHLDLFDARRQHLASGADNLKSQVLCPRGPSAVWDRHPDGMR